MHNLPDIVKAITLNNKLDESRDFATLVQRSMIDKLGASNKQIRDLGVRQAPVRGAHWGRHAEHPRGDLASSRTRRRASC